MAAFYGKPKKKRVSGLGFHFTTKPTRPNLQLKVQKDGDIFRTKMRSCLILRNMLAWNQSSLSQKLFLTLRQMKDISRHEHYGFMIDDPRRPLKVANQVSSTYDNIDPTLSLTAKILVLWLFY